MSNSDAQIITIVVLVFALAAFFVPLTIFFIYVFYQNSKRKSIRQRVLSNQSRLVGDRRWLPVRYASEQRFQSWFKIFPWEGAGILVLAPGSVLFLGETNSGQALSAQFSPRDAALNWIGKTPFKNGAVSWFYFINDGGKLYCTSETGAFIVGSDRSTKEVYYRALESFGSVPT